LNKGGVSFPPPSRWRKLTDLGEICYNQISFMNSARLKAYIYLLVTSVIWAVANPVIKFTLANVPPLLFLTYRFFISGLIGVLVLILCRPKFPKDSKTRLLLLVYALINSTITSGLFFWGLEKTTVVEFSLISLLGPIFINIAGVWLLNEKITKREKIGILIAILGMILTIIEPIFADGLTFGQFSGNFLIFLYLLSNTVAVVLTKKLFQAGVKSLEMTQISFIVGFFSLFPFLLFKTGWQGLSAEITGLSLSSHLGVWFVAIFSGTIAYWLFNLGQKTIEISEAALFSYLYPLLSIPIAVLWLGEDITLLYVLGSLIIFVGIIIAEVKK